MIVQQESKERSQWEKGLEHDHVTPKDVSLWSYISTTNTSSTAFLVHALTRNGASSNFGSKLEQSRELMQWAWSDYNTMDNQVSIRTNYGN